MSSTATLLGLPLELFEEVATYLSSNDLKALRHVSRASAIKIGLFYAKINHCHNSFTLRDETDMRRGLMIARHRLIGSALRKIRICIDEAGNPKERKFVDRCDDAKMLTTLFELLQVAGAKIQEVEVDGRPGHHGRTSPEKGGYRGVAVILRALVKSGLKPSSLVVRGGEWSLPVRQMGKDREVMDNFRLVLENLEALELDIGPAEESAAGVRAFVKMIGSAPKLTKLDIMSRTVPTLDALIPHGDPFISQILRQKLPQLERLALFGGCTTIQKLEAFVRERPPGQLTNLIIDRIFVHHVNEFQKPGETFHETLGRVLNAALDSS